MGRLLNIVVPSAKFRVLIALLAVVKVLLLSAEAHAGTYAAWHTGYAMGNRYGAAGIELLRGDFANHSPSWCPNDPAAYWQFGTYIREDQSITLPLQTYPGGTAYTYFRLEDIGDPYCTQGNYWVDIYFGRWKLPSQQCCCPGVICPGFCYNSNYNNSCTWATDFGRQWRGYNKCPGC